MALEAVLKPSDLARLAGASSRMKLAETRSDRVEVLRAGLNISPRTSRLESVDLAVRAHEAAHLAALGAAAAGGASFSYLIGPDGQRYAVGGSVRVVATPVPGDPEATIRRAKALINAAFAVGVPSPADMRVAAEAYEMEIQAKQEMARDRRRPAMAAQAFAYAGEISNLHEWFA